MVHSGTLRRISDVLMTMVPLLVAGAVTLELCVLIELPLNFANIVAMPLLLAFVEDRVFIEVHGDAYRRGAPSIARLRQMAARDGLADAIDWTLADQALQLREGVAVDVSRQPDAR